MESSCNLGYAGTCTWAPAQRIWDAVRFAVAAPADEVARGAPQVPETPMRVLRLIYTCERDHRPADGGELQFDLSQAAWVTRHEDARVQRMAECFLETYLTKKA